SELQAVRQAKAGLLRERGIDPYPARTSRSTDVAGALERFSAVEPTLESGAEDDEVLTVAGRLVSRRHQGKTVFAHVQDGTGQIQLYIRRDDVGEECFDDFLKVLDLGDFLEARG